MKKIVLPAIGVAAVFASTSDAATVSVSPDAPVLTDDFDISYFVETTEDSANVGAGDDPSTYVAGNRPVQGQTFTTSSGENGYFLQEITVQHRTYTTGTTDSFNFGTTQIRIGSVSEGVIAVDVTETAPLSGENGFASDGGGEFVTYTLDSPTPLLPDTVYGFDLGVAGGPFFELSGTSDVSGYTDGFAYTSGENSTGDTTVTQLDGNRVFYVNLTQIPEPSTTLLGGLGLVGLLRRRRS